MASLLMTVGIALFGQAPEPVGARPYEMDRAGRMVNPYPPAVTGAALAGWRVETRDAVASTAASREQRLWGETSCKLTYRATGGSPSVRLVAPEPLPCPAGFDTLALWAYGNWWGWSPDPTTPAVTIRAVFLATDGTEVPVYLQRVDSRYWHLSYRKLDAGQQGALAAGARLAAIELLGGANKEDRSLWLDDLSLLREDRQPLSYLPRPRRGIELPGQDLGANRGPGRLPFPTRPETIQPSQLAGPYRATVRRDGEAFAFEYAGADGRLTYRYRPRTGTFDDLTAEWAGRQGAFRPCSGGGLVVLGTDSPGAAQAELLGAEVAGDSVVARWRLRAGERQFSATYTLRLWAKSLVVEVAAPGGQVAEVRYGRAAGLTDARAVQVPYYVYSPGRPMLLVAGREQPLFLMGNTCWYVSNASELFGSPGDAAGEVGYNGGARYHPKTDGTRNDVFERLFVTVSPRLEEVLPTIPNPESPWKAVTGGGVWRAHGASNREQDAAYWRTAHRWGLRHLIITDHETMWRDDGESFTFRTRTAPGRGDDASAERYSRLLQDELGFVYGPYNNYTDFAPVNEYWDPDRVIRHVDGQLQTAWMRCYAPKPLFAVETCAELAPRIEAKFRFSTAYCDVHTAIPPWARTDYDARVPGAATFSQTFYAWGEIMLHQKAAWGGPVYSEGNYHVFLHGLTDGNYAQDQSARLPTRPWLVDFDLRQLHDLGCNFGMGNLDMFYAGGFRWGETQAERDAVIDRFLAATIAFGHPGFLVFEGGQRNALRSYYMIQQLAARYAPTPVDAVRYVDGEGNLLDSSAAVASGAFERSQVITTYTNGTTTVVNGSPRERLRARVGERALDLPPNGYAGFTADGAIEVFSGEVDGHRIDYAVTPEYLFIDGRGAFRRLPKAASAGCAIARRDTATSWAILPFEATQAGFALGGGTAVALDAERRELGPAEVRVARGLTYVMPVAGAFSYRLTPSADPAPALTCERERVVPGETVTVRGAAEHQVLVPADAPLGERLWIALESGWIDFTVVPLADLEARLDGNRLTVALRGNLTSVTPAELAVGETTIATSLRPGATEEVVVPLPMPPTERLEPLTVTVRAGALRAERTWIARTARGLRRLADVPLAPTAAGIRVRGGDELQGLGESGAQAYEERVPCGGDERPSLFMHPPYLAGVGYAWALLEPVAVPADAGALRCWVGKRDGSDLGDGILFRLVLVDDAGEHELARTQVTAHQWQPLEGDLTRWRGRTAQLKLIADVGEADNSSGDWACWSGLRIESAAEELYRTLEAPNAMYATEPGPSPLADLTQAALRGARSAWLVFDGAGLEGSDEYPTYLLINGVECGRMPSAGGDEVRGGWAERVRVALPAAAIATLGARNVAEIYNPAQDFFKVRRFYLELDLADGRQATSRVSTATVTQPPGWPYAEGFGVPQGTNIRYEVWVDLTE